MRNPRVEGAYLCWRRRRERETSFLEPRRLASVILACGGIFVKLGFLMSFSSEGYGELDDYTILEMTVWYVHVSHVCVCV